MVTQPDSYELTLNHPNPRCVRQIKSLTNFDVIEAVADSYVPVTSNPIALHVCVGHLAAVVLLLLLYPIYASRVRP